MKPLDRLRNAARDLKRETAALYFAARDPRTPAAARLLVGFVVAYALSPIDLIPDFIPILGLLDDLILVPLGIRLALRMIPPDAMQEARARAGELDTKPRSLLGALMVIAVWLALATLMVRLFL
ncbi:DUF1232 domain-containing protein [bacterium]|nr:MAG: DUF1232 domain-containing protein [bacterium]